VVEVQCRLPLLGHASRITHAPRCCFLQGRLSRDKDPRLLQFVYSQYRFSVFVCKFASPMFALRFIRPKVVRPCPTCFRAASTTTTTPATSHLRPFVYGTAVVIAGGAFIAYYSDSRSGIHQYVLAPLLTTVLDGEQAHKLALRTLRSGLHPRDPRDDDARLKVQVCMESGWNSSLNDCSIL